MTTAGIVFAAAVAVVLAVGVTWILTGGPLFGGDDDRRATQPPAAAATAARSSSGTRRSPLGAANAA
jgi:hypothetical protein